MMSATLPFASVNVAPPVTLAVMSPPSVLTVRLSVKSVSNTLAPATTWTLRTASKVGSSISPNPDTPNSVNSDPKASLVGANTVKGAGEVPVL